MALLDPSVTKKEICSFTPYNLFAGLSLFVLDFQHMSNLSNITNVKSNVLVPERVLEVWRGRRVEVFADHTLKNLG